ncbi:hypothetical protein MAPG_03368 [Magnaporthiopsis poae ATCC 64411]|uniref:PITH domain-containing protein n=1 Tax=Magnaporthiopsis poae (strain ATCC 64411 / 73-15) TaxID=644358 RepID=A0A0C4DTU2_MAGP6|nr:hypothetical protein MAPG_03368 [Magnaporthiopsis poae ATCC 64411]
MVELVPGTDDEITWRPEIDEITSLAQLGDLVQENKGMLVVVFHTPESEERYTTVLQQYQIFSVRNPHSAARVDVTKYPDIAAAYQIEDTPKAVAFRDGKAVQVSLDPDLHILRDLLNLRTFMRAPPDDAGSGAGGAGSAGESSGSAAARNWLGAVLPRGYKDISDQIELKRVELLNVDSEKGSVRVLFSQEKPSALSADKGKGTAAADWVESDTDEQLLLFMPFQSMLKLNTLQITSLPPTGDGVDKDEVPMRPKKIKLYTNRPHNLDFDQAESTDPTQEIEISASDWNAEGTANIQLRFVKFQNINSLVIFVESGHGSSEKVRLDRLRLIGDAGEKREMGKLEKIGDEQGE